MKNSLNFNNTYAKHLTSISSDVPITRFEKANWLCISPEVSNLLEREPEEIRQQWLPWLAGQQTQTGLTPIAQKYTGHQFGQYNPELGDGRGLLLGELQTSNSRFDIHLKGAGKTPFSRFGDGRAVLRSCIREYLASEALFHLGIPTSRALGVFTTGETVFRESPEQGAALIRVCESHLRFGHFEYAFYQNDLELSQQLVNYSVEFVLPKTTPEMAELSEKSSVEDKTYQLFKFIVRTTAEMVAKWQAFGFCHGVMNTDNMSILGLTFDYGPYGFLDEYNPAHICNHSDHSGRYAFDEQPSIALWNLNALAYSLSTILNKEQLTEILKGFEPKLMAEYSSLMRQKLGFSQMRNEDQTILSELLALMKKDQRDYTNTWRLLCHIDRSEEKQSSFIDHFIHRDEAQKWLNKYQSRLALEMVPDAKRKEQMQQVNPKYILRNYLAQEVIKAAEQGDYQPLDTLMKVLKQPFAEQPEFERYSSTPPDWAKQLEISCSS